PGLNRSEALRLTVDRYHFLESIAAPKAEMLVEKYRPVFQIALADLASRDFKVVARSLPAIVMTAVAEKAIRHAIETEWRQRDVSHDWNLLQEETANLDLQARVWLLDYVIRERHEAEERIVS